ncbi:FixH family protein [Actibacterium sp. MT2.3-13A]|uniref:FixH family protein n=1 Tax=Actibacterium sp. MT2.3-13A TaxID=2828332 RepID=UPI001BA91B07|nr:FixH family protein [Actibacterium sp. MT2.3-13A]
MGEKPLTGRTVLVITVAAFAVIIGVNVTMAVLAVGTFPGLEVKNSYVASQEFDARRQAQERLGWQVSTDYALGRLTVSFTDAQGLPVDPSDFSILIGRTTEAADDIRPSFSGYNGQYSTPLDLGHGKWMMLVEARAEDGTEFRQRLELFVRG